MAHAYFTQLARINGAQSSMIDSVFRQREFSLEAVDALAKLMDLEIEKYESSDEDL